MGKLGKNSVKLGTRGQGRSRVKRLAFQIEKDVTTLNAVPRKLGKTKYSNETAMGRRQLEETR